MAILPAIEPLGSDEMGLFGDPDPSSIGERQEQSVPTASVGNSYIDNLGKVGNLREKKDTCCLTALSINISDKRHPKIWEVLEMPSDAYKLSATPDGGALVFTGTSVLYVNQSQKTGVILHTEGVPAPENAPPLAFDPEKENPSDTAKRRRKVWSRRRDSLLLACTRREGDQESVPKMKKQKIDEQIIQEKEDVLEEYLEEDLLSIYAMTDNQQSPSEVDVRVCDSIISLGAMRKVISVPSDGQEEGQQFLACCGTAENGALAIMQYGLAPDKITTVPLPGLRGVWAIDSDTQTAVVLLGFENQRQKSCQEVEFGGTE
eukprot:jgi/Picre1/28897/NNA_004293.t1